MLDPVISSRHDITKRLNEVRCPTLIFVGEDSPFLSDAYHMISKLDSRYNSKLNRRDTWLEEVICSPSANCMPVYVEKMIVTWYFGIV